MKIKPIVCVCGSLEHQITILEEEPDYLCLAVHLSPKPFWNRVFGAVKHIFGYRCRYGDFEEILLDPDKALYLGETLIEWAQLQPPDGSVFLPCKKEPDALL